MTTNWYRKKEILYGCKPLWERASCARHRPEDAHICVTTGTPTGVMPRSKTRGGARRAGQPMPGQLIIPYVLPSINIYIALLANFQYLILASKRPEALQALLCTMFISKSQFWCTLESYCLLYYVISKLWPRCTVLPMHYLNMSLHYVSCLYLMAINKFQWCSPNYSFATTCLT